MALAKNTILTILAICTLTVSMRAAGEVDTSFQGKLENSFDVWVRTMVRTPDGKFMIGGMFRTVGGQPRSALARLNSDGTVDPTFNGPDFYNSFGVVGRDVLAIAVQPDGRVLVGGEFVGAGPAPGGLVRLNADGSIDPTFLQVDRGVVKTITIFPDGDIFIGGNLSVPGRAGDGIRLNPDGSLDSLVYAGIASSGRGVTKALALPDGRLLAGTDSILRRYDTAGSFDAAFTTVAVSFDILALHLLPDGKVLVGGPFNPVAGTTSRGIFRTNVDGGVDTAFNAGGAGANFGVTGIAPAGAGRVFVHGGFTTFNGVQGKGALITTDGAMVPGFTYGPPNFSQLLAVQMMDDGRFLLGGVLGGPFAQNSIRRLLPDGSHEGAYDMKVGSGAWGMAMAVQSDNKIVVAGRFILANGISRMGVARFNPNGTVDESFEAAIGASPSQGAYSLEILPDGKILVGFGGSSSQVGYRLNSNGSLDISYNVDGSFGWDMEYLASGKVLVAADELVRRFNANGSTDVSTFAEGNSYVLELTEQPDGKVILGGAFTTLNGNPKSRLARLNADGSFDNTFVGSTNGNVDKVFLQPDGKILIGGPFTSVNGDSTKQYLARLNADGTLDNTFSVALNGPAMDIKVQLNGKIIIGGAMSAVNGVTKPGIARLNSNGTLDSSFNTGTGTNSTVWDVELLSDGSVVYAGQFTGTNGHATPGIGKLLNPAAPVRAMFDYDGDNKSDVSVFRPSENKWYVFRSSDSVVSQVIFAIPGDVPVPADYDGDGKTDVAIFRPSAGDWWYFASSDGTQRSVHWGTSGDIARPSDFDGDGKADFIVFRPGENNWYRLGSTGLFSAVNFGLAGDKPVTGDFDGDSKTDVAIYRPSTGDWWWKSSVDGVQRATHFGISTDTPAPADYDGDGKTDFAVYRASTGVWYIMMSQDGRVVVTAFGLSEDKPVAADYDGDGRADIAVFRPSSGVWYLLRSTAGFTAMQFGISTDTPTPNAFVP